MNTINTRTFYPASVDRVFKSIFLSEHSEGMMQKLLESILAREVKIIDYPRCDLPITKVFEKVTTVDFLVRTDGELIHLEVETNRGPQTRVKNFTGFTKIMNQDHVRGKLYQIATRYIHIDFQYGISKKRPLMDTYTLKNKEGNRKYIDNFEIIQINMDKVKEFWYAKDEEKIHENKYLMMLCLEEEELRELEKMESGDETLEEFVGKITKLNNFDRFQSYMSDEEKREWVHRGELLDAEQRGISKGMKTGQALGIETGKKERELEIVKASLKQGLDVSIIANIVGLSVQKIESMKNEFESE